jgi:hypothetical protein
MPRILSAGLYREKDLVLISAHQTKAQAVKAQTEDKDFTEVRFFYNIYPSQVAVLSYAQAVDLENIIETAKSWKKI